jgi:hypothetical protein
MSAHPIILLEGTYVLYEKNASYAEENFKFLFLEEIQQYHLISEIVSRVETGEFLKILVTYEMSHHYIPFSVQIEKTMGTFHARETFKIDTTEQELRYSFVGQAGTHEFQRPVSAKHYLTTPAFATSAFFTLTKKFDPSSRTPVIFLSSPNEWEYLGPPEEKLVYAEYKSREAPEFKIHDKELAASHLCIFEHSPVDHADEEPMNLYISRYHGLPYELVHGDQKIVAKKIKKNY